MHSVCNCFGNVENIKHHFRWRALRWLVEISFTCQSTFGAWWKAFSLIPLKFSFTVGRFQGLRHWCRGPVFLPRKNALLSINKQALDPMTCQLGSVTLLQSCMQPWNPVSRVWKRVYPRFCILFSSISISHNPSWILSFIPHTAKAMLHPRGETVPFCDCSRIKKFLS